MVQTAHTSPPLLTGVERRFADRDIIVTKTDPSGRLTYVNDVFLQISALTEYESLGKPHNLIRHPHMPKCVFRMLWETLQSGREMFAYVLNRAMNGDHYWVLAHVTPSFDAGGRIIGYHSNRRVPYRQPLEQAIQPLYAKLLRVEQEHGGGPASIKHSAAAMADFIGTQGGDYEKFIFSTFT